MKKNLAKSKIRKNERHIRWNWERVEDKVRYHFIVVDDKNREGIMNKIIEPLQKYDSIESIRKKCFDVKNSKLKALFHTYDSPIKPELLELYKTGKLIRRDFDLYERKVGTLEDYVGKFFYEED